MVGWGPGLIPGQSEGIYFLHWLHALNLWVSTFSLQNTWGLRHAPNSTRGYCSWVGGQGGRGGSSQISTECTVWNGIPGESEIFSLPTRPLRIKNASGKALGFWAKQTLVHIPLPSCSLCLNLFTCEMGMMNGVVVGVYVSRVLWKSSPRVSISVTTILIKLSRRWLVT